MNKFVTINDSKEAMMFGLSLELNIEHNVIVNRIENIHWYEDNYFDINIGDKVIVKFAEPYEGLRITTSELEVICKNNNRLILKGKSEHIRDNLRYWKLYNE